MIDCKICETSFIPKHHLSLLCSKDCQRVNRGRIKRAYYNRNKDMVIERSSAWRKENPEKYKKISLNHRIQNPEKVRERWIEYAKKNRDKINEKSRRNNQKPERKGYMLEYKKSPCVAKKLLENGRKYKRGNPEVVKNGHLKRKFGITVEDFKKMQSEQNGVCKICGKSETRLKKGSDKIADLAVDHCHKTGQVRGLLCFKCNSSIGKLGDSVELLQKAIDYLNSHK